MLDASVKATPRALRLEASTACQLACPSCPTPTGETHKFMGKGHLSAKSFEKLLEDNWGKLKAVELSNFGEAFLNPRLLDIFRSASRHDVALTMYNGVNLNNAKEEVLEGAVKYGVRGMTCSIDGASQETYSIYRKRGNFDTVIANIEKINKYKKQYRTIYPRLRWQFVVFGHNEHEITKAKAMAAALDMAFVPKLSWDSEFSPIQDVAKAKKEAGFKEASREKIFQETGEIFLGNICQQLWDVPQINYDGRVLGCCVNYWGDFGGNAFENLEAAVNSEKMMYARAMLMGLAPARDDLPCAKCGIFQSRLETKKWVSRRDPKQKLKQWAKSVLWRHDSLRLRLAGAGIVASKFLNPSRL